MRDRRGKKTGRRSLKKKALLCGGLTLICLAGLWVYGESRPVVDTLYPEQWNLEAIHIEEAWGAGLTGEGVTIGVIDSGTAEQEDLDESRITGRSYVDEDPEDYKDSRGHGTFVTGLLAAKRGNGKGIAGLTQSAVREYKVAGEQPHIGAADVAQAIRDGADEGCGVLNLSIGTPNANEETEEVLIQEGRDLVTLITCHPYRHNYQRYVVYCERVEPGLKRDVTFCKSITSGSELTGV